MRDDELLIGQILQKYQLITSTQFEDALRAHGQVGAEVTLAEFLTMNEYITPEQAVWLAQAVRHYVSLRRVGKSHRLGEVEVAEPLEQATSARVSVLPSGEAVAAESKAQDGQASWTPVRDLSQLLDEPAEPAPSRPQPAQRPVTTTGKVAIGILRPTRRHAEPQHVPSASASVPQSPLLAIEELKHLIREARQAGASDLYLHVGHPPFHRLRGRLERSAQRAVSSELTERLIEALLDEGQQLALRENGDVCVAYETALGRLRVCVSQTQLGGDLAMRLLPSRVPTLQELGLPPSLGKPLEQGGLLLCLGAAHSGKSTTLAALLDQCNSTRDGQMLIVQDPVELIHQSRRCRVHWLRKDASGSSTQALRDVLLRDFDIVGVDELVDFEMASLLLPLAQTGRLVIATMTAPDPALAVEQLVQFFPEEQRGQARESLCRCLSAVVVHPSVSFEHGRQPAVEVLEMSPSVTDLIRSGRLGDLGAKLHGDRAEA